MARIFERALGLVCALLPVAGVLLFGWSLASVLFVIWLDTWLHSLRIIPAIMDDTQLYDPGHPVAEFLRKLLAGVFIWLIFSGPLAAVGGITFDALAERVSPGGFRVETYDLLFDAPWWLAIIVVGRLFPCARELVAAHAQGRQRFAAALKSEFLLGLSKCVVLVPIAWLAPVFGEHGYWGVLAFAALASITIAASEWFLEYRLGDKPRVGKPLEVVHGFDGRSLKR